MYVPEPSEEYAELDIFAAANGLLRATDSLPVNEENIH